MTDACLICGYDTSGLDNDHPCPECTARVGDSRHGLLIASSPGPYRERLRHGVILVESITIIGLVSHVILTIVIRTLTLAQIESGASWEEQLALMQITMAGGALFLFVLDALVNLGWWWVSTPDPRFNVPDRAAGLRRAHRAGLILYVLASGAELALSVLWLFMSRTMISMTVMLASSQASMLVKMFVGAASFFLIARYVRVLARRLGARRLRSWAESASWMAPLLAISGYVIMTAEASWFAWIAWGVIWLTAWVGMIDLLRRSLPKASY